ncbi:DUF1524 domain-containing protein [Kitasatospora phosalacinea]|uniref:GmrSD restriction endonuclease domain-containing protein n=1 Tax=Kitasatospora phosalacinea TaxID=2065 RepID=UPI003666AF38
MKLPASRASAWSAAERQAYANDLDEPRALIAVSAKSNRSKAGKDVVEWLPPAADYRCTYLTDWTTAKTRWSLTVDQVEADALHRLAVACPDNEFTVTLARWPASSRTRPRRGEASPDLLP